MLKPLILTFVLSTSIFSQGRNDTAPQDEFINGVIRTLEPSNVLKNDLERGHRGTGPHFPWMDELKKHGTRQVSAAIKVTWRKNELQAARFKFIHYMPKYYEYGTYITDRSLLDAILASRLEQTLKAEICREARALLMIIGKDKDMKGTVYINLLDDERLPAPVDMPELNRRAPS